MKTTTFNESDKFVIILAIGNQLCKRCDSILFSVNLNVMRKSSYISFKSVPV